MAKTIAWSWSRLSDFEQCPRKFQGRYITKDFPKPDFDAPHFVKGRAAHKLLEDHFKGEGELHGTVTENGLDFSFDFRFLSKISDEIKKHRRVFPELQVTFDVRMNEISWFDKKAWCRVIFDLLIIIGDYAVIIDWKTGKVKEYSDQLKLFAGAVMTKYPNIKKVLTCYVWVDHPKQPPVWAEYTDKDREHIWQEFGDRSELIQLANESGNWPAKKNIFCKWCDALPSQCEYKN